MNKTDIALMTELMGYFTQTKEWYRIYGEDIGQKAASMRFADIMEELEKSGASELASKISDSVCDMLSATERNAILYGMHVANAIRNAMENPSDLLRHNI